MELIPENIYVAIGQLVIFILIIKGKDIVKFLLSIKNGKNGKSYEHNPNFQTLEKDIRNSTEKICNKITEQNKIFIRLTTIVDERLPKKK